MTTQNLLVVEDDEAISTALLTLLTHAGYKVSVAHTGPEALERLAEEKYDLVILDIMLPEVDGHEVCRRIRQAPDYTPVLMLTARSDLSDRLLGLELGADVYLTKPFETGELLAHVRALFRLMAHGPANNPSQAAQPLVCGSLVLWENQYRVEQNGAPLELTRTEYRLLQVLMQQPGHVFGREALLRQVWGYDYPGDTRTVDVHVQRLRAKIEEDPSQPKLLQTVRGFGYRLVAPAPEQEGP
jgi:two-component system alkaline phosphatase synthesis response regulator PhoP